MHANPEHEDTLSDNTLHLSVPLIHEVDTTITGVVSPTSFVYGDSVDAARFVQMDNMQCFFQPLNYTFQVINNGPSRLPGSTVHILLPNRLGSSGAEMLHVQETVVGQEKGNCTYHRNPTPCTIPQDQESIFHTIFAFFTKSGRKVVDCERPGRSCLIITCLLSSLAKEESRSIDVRILLNTEILKKDTSSVIQFVTRGSVMVDTNLRAVEVSNGLSEHTTVVFEALHNMEPRGYVVGWIIAISLLVGILIFLLLAVLLWKIGFFRRRYKEIIEAEKNRKDSDESWDWVQKSQ
ncbi:Integrin alpha-9 [Acipenser ruthenus]|uniref:Integrin alpha-9 n=1 Tax=Acipenser ruthenus TaxID=7906 RepID=A0A662Z215_ACIRT|nr:Integrin alpha-9 [Acipenser ruthenus]